MSDELFRAERLAAAAQYGVGNFILNKQDGTCYRRPMAENRLSVLQENMTSETAAPPAFQPKP